jgi:hypothetical protein
MTLSRDFKHTVIERVQREPAFAKAMLDETATLFLNGEPDTARLILRDLVNATVGFKTLARKTKKTEQKPAPHALARRQSEYGQPRGDFRRGAKIAESRYARADGTRGIGASRTTYCESKAFVDNCCGFATRPFLCTSHPLAVMLHYPFPRWRARCCFAEHRRKPAHRDLHDLAAVVYGWSSARPTDGVGFRMRRRRISVVRFTAAIRSSRTGSRIRARLIANDPATPAYHRKPDKQGMYVITHWY